MSLYDGLSVETAPLQGSLAELTSQPSPPDTKDEEKTSWNTKNFKLMASQLQRQKATRGRGRGALRGRGLSTLSVQKSVLRTLPSEPTISMIEDDLAGELEDEYDPMLPNNYEEIMAAEKEKERLKRDMLRQKRKEMRRYSSGSDDEDEREREREERRRERKRKSTMAIPPPPPMTFAPPKEEPKEEMEVEVQSGEDGDQMIKSALQELSKIKAPKANPYGKSFKASTVASGIMSKYGWQEGQGLGKASQGISTALSVQKTSFRGGKIVNVAAEREKEKEEEKQKIKTLSTLIKNPTKVLLLQNMVGPGEVDDDLQPEVIEECSKYGEVANCLIYEIPQGAEDDEAVRIFVQFVKVDSAIKAMIELNGRYFGGRIVTGSFYSESKFERFDLAPETT